MKCDVKTIGIVGATSPIGQALVVNLLDRGFKVIATYRDDTKLRSLIGKIPPIVLGNLVPMKLDLDQMDMLSLAQLRELAGCYAIYLCIWSGTKNRNSIDDNSKSRRKLAAFMQLLIKQKQMNCLCVEKLIFLGSWLEYGPVVGLVDENTRCMPETIYGKEKFEFGKLFELYAKELCCKWYHFRIHSIYGPYKDGILWHVINELYNGRKVTMQTNCLQLWNFMYIDDCINALVQPVIENIPSSIYNLGADECKPLRDYLEMAKDIVGLDDKEIVYGALQYNTSDCCYCTTKYRKQSGWEEKIIFSEGVEHLFHRAVEGQ